MDDSEPIAILPADDTSRFAGLPSPLPSTSTLIAGLNAAVWPATVAVITVLVTFLGIAREQGRSSALGLYGLSNSPIDQRDIFGGVGSLLEFAITTICVFVVARLAFLLAIRIKRLASSSVQEHLQKVLKHSSVTWLMLILLLADVGFLNKNVLTLRKEADGIILKSTSQIGSIWTSILLDENRMNASNYEFVFIGGAVLFVGVASWLLKRLFKNRLGRMMFSCYVVIELLGLMLAFSFFKGVVDTIDEFPIVAFSNQEKLFGDHSLSVLLGSDDKQFAFLVIFPQTNPQPPLPKRVIFYLPRAEVRWMSIVALRPLQPLGKYDELERLAKQLPSTAPAQ